MARFFVLLASLLFAAPALAAGIANVKGRQYLSDYGDILYYAHQGEWFDAIVLFDAHQERSRGSDGSTTEAFSSQPGHMAGGFELKHRMHQRAERAMKAVIDVTAEDDLRNEALFRLARMNFQNDRPEEALHAVERIRGNIPAAIRSELAFLRANIALTVGRNAEAVAILKDLQSEKGLEGFSSYNLGIALLRAGSEQPGRKYLDRTGRIESDDRAVLAIKDKANLILGEKLLSEGHFKAAKEVLDRVRLSGPFSNRSLLNSGWADASRERFDNALVPWSILAGRKVTESTVQEAMLAVPYAYSRLGVYSTAALKYEAALKAFGGEIARLDASIVSIREGKFLKRLMQEDLHQDAGWIVSLRELPVTPETFYLLDLMASDDFQESLKNYLDLEQLLKKLEVWSGDLASFGDIIRLRQAHYKPLLPVIDREFKRLDAQMRLRSEQRDRIAQQLEAMLTVTRPELMMTADERIMSEQVARLERMMTPRRKKITPRLWHQIRRLRGVLVWNIHAEYDKRFADARKHLRELDHELDVLNRQHRAFARTRQTVTESYEGYDDVIRSLRQRINAAQGNVRALLARQGQVLEIMAVNELTRRRDRIEEFRGKARFGLADSYDRAAKTDVQEKGAQ